MKNTFRWIAYIPIGILAAVLSVLAFQLFIELTTSYTFDLLSIRPYFAGTLYEYAPTTILSGVVWTLAYFYSGMYVAPAGSKRLALKIMFTLCFIFYSIGLLCTAVLWVMNDYDVVNIIVALRCIATLITSLFMVTKRENILVNNEQ